MCITLSQGNNILFCGNHHYSTVCNNSGTRENITIEQYCRPTRKLLRSRAFPGKPTAVRHRSKPVSVRETVIFRVPSKTILLILTNIVQTFNKTQYYVQKKMFGIFRIQFKQRDPTALFKKKCAQPPPNLKVNLLPPATVNLTIRYHVMTISVTDWRL